MHIAGPLPSTGTLTLANTPNQNWRVGQHISAEVTAILSQDKVTLRIGNVSLDAHTTLSAAVGQRLQLEVIRADNKIVMRIIPPDTIANNSIITSAIRESLPKQQPLQAVLTVLNSAVSAPSNLSPTVVILVKQLIGLIPELRSLTTPDGLKTAILNSGLFMENKLANIEKFQNIEADLKISLLRLLAQFKHLNDPGSKSINSAVEAGLARIQHQQLTAAADSQPTPTAWLGELPLRNNDTTGVLHFHIQKDKDCPPESDQSNWSTWLILNLDDIGTMYAKVNISNKSVGVILWAESESALNMIKTNLDTLHQYISDAGLTVKNLQCYQGKPSLPKSGSIPQALLDIYA